jgi:hypothetical protein
MKMRPVYTMLAAATLLLGPANPGLAAERGAGPPGDPGVIAGRAAWHGGFHGHGRVGVFVGPGVWWGGPWWWGPGYPYYDYPGYSYPYYAPPVYVQPQPPPQQPYYWYYCQNPQGYYPYVQQCPNGWMQVVPPASPPR